MDSSALLILVAGLVFASQESAAQVEVEPREALVVPGQNVSFMCRMGAPLQYCRVMVPGVGTRNLNEKTERSPNDKVIYYGEGLSHGQCGFTLLGVSEENNGIARCVPGVPTFSEEPVGEMSLVVARAPLTPQLTVSNDTNSNVIHQPIKATCVVKDGRPPANISWFLNDERLYGEESVLPPSKDNLWTTQQTITRTLEASDNMKDLRCVAYHPAYSNGFKEAQKQLDVRFAPLPQTHLDKFGFIIGKPGVISVIVEANPKPTFKWTIGDQELREKESDSTGRITAEASRDLRPGQYEANLRFSTIEKRHTEYTYVLTAYNAMGSEDYAIRISTSPEPEGVELGVGGIVGIIVGVLFLLLLIFVLVFAKVSGRWCFSGNTQTKTLGESSDTESAEVRPHTKNFPPIKLTSFFKKQHSKEEPIEPPTTDPAPETKEGLVYAELDLVSPQNVKAVVKDEDEKTEYAEIVYSPKDKQ